jgi:hypothetical protein
MRVNQSELACVVDCADAPARFLRDQSNATCRASRAGFESCFREFHGVSFRLEIEKEDERECSGRRLISTMPCQAAIITARRAIPAGAHRNCTREAEF